MTTTYGPQRRRGGATSGRGRVQGGLLDPKMLWRSTPDAFRKLNPATLYKNPVMFIVELGSVYTTWLAIRDHTAFAVITTMWLWLTVLFANVAEAVAAACRWLREHPDDVRAWGLAGKAVAEQVTWDHAIERLLAP